MKEKYCIGNLGEQEIFIQFLLGMMEGDYKHYISLAVNIFIRCGIICVNLGLCRQKHVCLEA